MQDSCATRHMFRATFATGLDAFKSLIDNTYDFRGKVGVPSEQLKSLGVPQQFIDAADKARQDFRWVLHIAQTYAAYACA